MFEKSQIKEHMEVTNYAGQHIGTVDEIEGERINLTRKDSADGAHHFISMDQVDSVEADTICLKEGTSLPASGSD